MKKENTSTRLKTIIKDRGLKQVDILNKALPFCQKYGVKMNKSDISQYVSGKNEPGQDKLYILGKALNVSEAWLMGYDVPMKRHNNNRTTEEASLKIIQYYEQLNDIGKNEATKRVEELTYIQKYIDNVPGNQNSLDVRSEATEEKFNSKVTTMMSENDPRYVDAAHSIDGASKEDMQFDEDIMNDENF